jgi:hypothetical protein
MLSTQQRGAAEDGMSVEDAIAYARDLAQSELAPDTAADLLLRRAGNEVARSARDDLLAGLASNPVVDVLGIRAGRLLWRVGRRAAEGEAET